ncbi:FprA family A-type flavoprotein [Geobacter sp. SVR]|uniref:FprA family A-type flavoprotein n=1 Tax=Geobacter sp. SVR TaxID=2495594 RepID=UPI00143EFC0B|nr:FprA family A-type flavoprotein [Geobacter sp. SVR]BCS52079.1 anaerobic nitric oxide reductase flavorubredoxin [Geobacter sp. SVR]GCF86534.1 anaerobic nitric oxide reductase flavorubredoxin [Geobacter sp. SVR]
MSAPIEIKPGLFWIGSEDPDLRTFDDLFPTEHGTTYNSYLLKGTEKTVIIDTVKAKRTDEFMDKIKALTTLEGIDYIIANHTEPDHSGALAYLLEQCPQATVVSTMAGKNFLTNLLHRPFKSLVVKDGDTLDLGGRTLRFIIAPFLHWPDTMFTRLEEENILFTCDAFGAHYCSPGKVFNDENVDFTSARHFYFDCIFRPFKDKVLSAVEKIRHDVIDMICPSHGPILRKAPWRAIEQFESWSKPTSWAKKVVILYISPHGNTEIMARSVAEGAAVDGIEVSSYHISHLSSNEVRNLMEDADALIFGIPTIARDIPKPMWDVLAYLSTVKLKTNLAGLFGSYGWSGEACKMAEERLKSMGFRVTEPIVKTIFTPTAEALKQCSELGRSLAEEVLKKG